MIDFIEYLVDELNFRKVTKICGTTEITLRKYINGGNIRPSLEKKIASNIDVWVSTVGDERLDSCTDKTFMKFQD